ncbi:MAG: arsenate reductase family protein [Pyrinomonadaceae bacterium]
MSEKIEVYWLPHCTTCKKAAAELMQRGVKVSVWRDLKASPLNRVEVEMLAKKVGGIAEMFSKRARKYRELGLDKRTLSDDEMLSLMCEDYTFIKRPVVVKNELAMAGWTPKTYTQLFGES